MPIRTTLLRLFLVASLTPLLKLTMADQITNIKCIVLDKSCVDFTECRLRMVKRDVNEISVYAKLFQLPVVNTSFQLKFMKKSNGYRPYFGEVNYDGCKFLETQKNPLVKYLYSFLLPYTNVNHTCPINHDIVLRNYRIDEKLLKGAGFLPTGEYAFFITWTFNSMKCGRTEMFFKHKE
ncbi:uncharacterized protein LOC126753034 [Bactrocera neohumeralis]|uniref:uncharacterized protein LOC126753034 n=1 Tax=Bactrocera neohumeralis TaxID=98809 RepID=UPI002166A2EF|nr:uncharacterized protein LOC126753034 [Bactrocera neohumeralis]